MLVDTGLVGIVLYVTFWFLLLRALLSLPKAEKTLWLVVFASFGPSFLSLSVQHDKTLWFLCALVLAQAAAWRRSVAARRRAPRPPPSASPPGVRPLNPESLNPEIPNPFPCPTVKT